MRIRHELFLRIGAWALLALAALFCRPLSADDQVTRGERIARPSQETVRAGANWLVLIAINDYMHATPLQAPLSDVSEIKRVLLEYYQFDQEHTLELLNDDATLSGMRKLFGTLVERVAPNDTLLLYYAGHGHFDDVTRTGYWIPYDGGTEFGQNWLPDTAVQGTLLSLKARHVLVVADSCFSGNLLSQMRSLGGEPEISEERYRRAYELRSRKVLTSGNIEPVVDAAYGDHSAFAYHLMTTLESNQRPYFDAEDLYYHVRAGVDGQQPLLGSLGGSGHQTGGSYLFFRKGAAVPAAPDLSASVAARPAVDLSTSAAPSLVDDSEQEIEAALTRWEEAYETLNFTDLRDVWPSCPWDRRQFRGVEGFEIEMPRDDLEIRRTGVDATVRGTIHISAKGRSRNESEYRAEFRLRKQHGVGWQIIDYKPLQD